MSFFRQINNIQELKCHSSTNLLDASFMHIGYYQPRNIAERNSNSNSNSKTLTLKDSSVRSIWTYLTLTVSPCYTTNTNKHDYTRNRYYKENQGALIRLRQHGHHKDDSVFKMSSAATSSFAVLEIVEAMRSHQTLSLIHI